MTKMGAIVTKGAVVDAAKEFLADHATTSDNGGNATIQKSDMIKKRKVLLAQLPRSMASPFTIHHSIVEDNGSASEFTFDFDMKDGSKISWHEIIRRIWDETGRVTSEEYFNA